MCDRFHVDRSERTGKTEGMVVVAKNGLRSNLGVYHFKKKLWQERSPVPLADACYARTECAHAGPRTHTLGEGIISMT